MTLALVGDRGWLGDLATNTGFRDLKQALSSGDEAMKAFAKTHETNDPHGLAISLGEFLVKNRRSLDPSIVSTMRNMQQMLQHTKQKAMVTES